MLKKIAITCISFIIFLSPIFNLAKAQPVEQFGQTIQITTQLGSFVGNPAWLLIVRDLDHGIVYPYLYDFTRGDHFWIALSHSHHYRITVSELQFNPYQEKITNFCGLENGVLDGESMTIQLYGHLTSNKRTVKCHVSKYKDMIFHVNTERE